MHNQCSQESHIHRLERLVTGLHINLNLVPKIVNYIQSPCAWMSMTFLSMRLWRSFSTNRTSRPCISNQYLKLRERWHCKRVCCPVMNLVTESAIGSRIVGALRKLYWVYCTPLILECLTIQTDVDMNSDSLLSSNKWTVTHLHSIGNPGTTVEDISMFVS